MRILFWRKKKIETKSKEQPTYKQLLHYRDWYIWRFQCECCGITEDYKIPKGCWAAAGGFVRDTKTANKWFLECPKCGCNPIQKSTYKDYEAWLKKPTKGIEQKEKE